MAEETDQEHGATAGGGVDPAAMTLALGQPGKLDPRAASYLEEQTAILRMQKAGLEEEQRLQLSHLRLRRFGDYAKAAIRGSEANKWVMQSDILDLILKMRSGAAELKEREILQISILSRVLLGNAQDVYVQHSAGLVDQLTFDHTLASMTFWLSNPAFRASWRSARTGYAAEWMAYVDKLIEQTPLARPVDAVARFKADLAEVLR